MCAYVVASSVLNMLRRQCLADLKSCKQTNIPIYSFSEHQRLDETKYLYGAAIIISACRSAAETNDYQMIEYI